MTLSDFVAKFASSIAAAVIRTYPPLYDGEARRSSGYDLRRLRRRPLGAQGEAIRATALSLRQHPGTIVVGEMGVGKTFIAAAAAYLAGFRRVLITCPPHMTKKWQREILQTVWGAQVTIVRTITDLERVRVRRGAVQFVICSREQAKLGYRWKPAAVARPARNELGGLLRNEHGDIALLLSCPSCFAVLADAEGVPLDWHDLGNKRLRCEGCGGPLWQADRTGPRRVPSPTTSANAWQATSISSLETRSRSSRPRGPLKVWRRALWRRLAARR